ncbi:hypothetical protein [Bradyrhizobium sp.]|uniref:hypothetical protein n=1 Tax=Bradyrhizobium sp. TaxID=376 RepID=UPI003C4DFF04
MNADRPIRDQASDTATEDPLRPTDEQILQHLGAAAMLCWNELPFSSQTRILSQANDVIGLTPIPGARAEIVRLMLRRERMG